MFESNDELSEKQQNEINAARRERRMSSWTKEELAQAEKEDLYISAPNEDGTMHAPTWIWMVVVDGALYCRSYNGANGRWYTAAKRAGNGRAKFGTVDRPVSFEFVNDETVDTAVDEAYRVKYAGSPYLDGPFTPRMRSTTVRLMPSD